MVMEQRITDFLTRYREPLSLVAPPLAYLLVLAGCELKPLVRLEWDAGEDETQAIEACGLVWATVHRSGAVDCGGRQTVFSPSPEIVRKYVEVLDHKAVVLDSETMRTEGELLGYPACCIDSYVCDKSYHRTRGQEPLLLHWPCPGCDASEQMSQRFALAATMLASRLGLKPWW